MRSTGGDSMGSYAGSGARLLLLAETCATATSADEIVAAVVRAAQDAVEVATVSVASEPAGPARHDERHAVLPLTPAESLQVALHAPATPDDAVWTYLAAAAACAATGLARLEATAGGAGAATRQSTEVLAYSAALADADSFAEVTAVVVRSVLPAFGATGVLISLADSGRLRIVGHAGYSPEAVQALDGLPIHVSAPIAAAMRTRTPAFLSSLEDYVARYPTMADVARLTAKQSWAFVPLVVSGRALGSLTISYDAPRPFYPAERSLLVALGGLLAQGIERARLRDNEHALATALQRGLLPRDLPTVPGLTTSARYLTATNGMDVGGDWYDVISLPGGSVALVVGDVQGHNVAAAATMGQLRNAVRAYALEGHLPGTVLARASGLLAEIAPDVFATCCYVALDPATGVAQVVRAGHPHPVLRRAAGCTRLLELPGGLPLGMDPDAHYPRSEAVLEPGDLLVLYTDGLVEGPEPVRDGTPALLSAVEGAGQVEDLDALADLLAGPATAAGHRADDIALLCARFSGTSVTPPPEMAALDVDQDDLRTVGQARRHLAATLESWSLGGLTDVAALLLSEVVTNAVVHAAGAASVVVRRLPDRVRIEVRDQVSARPHSRAVDVAALAGRGLLLVEALSDAWGTVPSGEGKLVWFELGTG